MFAQKKTASLLGMLALFVCLNSVLPMEAAAQLQELRANYFYTHETIDVPDVNFLALTASSDFEDYAGYTRNADGKEVAFTLMDGVFKTYDFPGSQKTHFYALGNDGTAAGHYEDSEGQFHGIILENGEFREYNFPGSVETEIYGISDATGALTGNFTDADGIRRGFTGDEIIEFPGAVETFADFINSSGGMVGSYIDADGLYHSYQRTPGGIFINLRSPGPLEYMFVQGINDAWTVIVRAKAFGRVPQTFVGTFQDGLIRFEFPGAVFTEGWNINQDGSIVGHYDTADGRRHGFISRPIPGTPAEPVEYPAVPGYTFESIDVPGVDYLAVTASSDFEDYAGNTLSSDGQKMVGFTLMDGVFKTYDFPGSKNTYFYALGNDGRAAGHYEDSGGQFHGIILENGELRQFNYPGAVQTEIYGISDSTGDLTGNFIDADGVRKGFTGGRFPIVEFPKAVETYAEFMNGQGSVVGSYVDAMGLRHAYLRNQFRLFVSFVHPEAAKLEVFSLSGLNDARVAVIRSKLKDDVSRTYVGTFIHGLNELRVPGSVGTEGWNINQDGSVVGHYDSPDGRRHGFIARPAAKEVSDRYDNAYTVALMKGLNMISVPLKPPAPMNAKALAGLTGSTTVIKLDEAKQRFVGWTPGAPNDGFDIEGGKGYIVNVPTARHFAFAGAAWTDPVDTAQGAPPLFTENIQSAWAFVVSGHLEGKRALEGYKVLVRNLRTNETIAAPVQDGYFAAATADLSRRSVVEAGDAMDLQVVGPDGNIESQTFRFDVTSEHLANAVLPVTLYGIGMPSQSRLLQNYPNPFNPETWIPYQLAEDSDVSIEIYDASGRLIRSLSLGHQPAGFYNSRGRAAYWDGRNAVGEQVASGVYFYHLKTPTFRQTRRLLILK